jgi:hypothetical protein
MIIQAEFRQRKDFEMAELPDTKLTVAEEQHIYHHYDNDGAKINVSTEKNTKGYNWSVTVTGASSIAEACRLLFQAEQELQKQYGQPVTAA